MGVEHFLESVFESIGRKVGRHPVKSLVGSVIFVIACGGGFAFLTSETRPEKQWVPAGSLALDHNEYVSATWPGNARINLFSATCADVDEGSCNILDPKYIQRFHMINEKIMNITIDGDELVAQLDADHKRSEGDNRPWTIYAGNWDFNGQPRSVNGTVVFDGRKCFAFGPFCGKQSVLDVFRDDDYIIENLDATGVKRALNQWEDQETFCPLTLAVADSPCFNDNCIKYKTTAERQACRSLATTYCSSRCPTTTIRMPNGEEVTRPNDLATCQDRGCIQLGAFGSSETTTTPPGGQLNTDVNATGQAPESAFEFQPTKVSTMVGGLVSDSNWRFASGKYIAGFYALNKNELYCPRVGQGDPVADEWERRALCYMGIDADPRAEPKLTCEPDPLLKFNGLFQRSLGDEFGNAIRGDISKLTASYGVIIVYCAIMIGRCDAVHSGVALSMVAVLIVGLTIASTLGLMGYFQVPNGNLNNNLYFLLLGLGVDDAFVLTSEYIGHTRENKDLPIEERIAKTARTGGISVLITSATDALAFLVGATTVLPALGWFCTYAGVSIILCFTFQLTVFLPVLALNARRVESSRVDCCCCFKATPRPLDEPKGCCCFCLPAKAYQGGLLKRGMKSFAEMVTTPIGQIVTIAVFLGVAVAGVYGSTLIYKDFKLEWFIPDSSYVNEFFNINSEYFATGTAITVNFPGTMDAFDQQQNLHDVYSYLNTSDLINRDVVVDSWYREFMEWATEPNQAQTMSASFTPSRTDTAVFADRSEFYDALHFWYRTAVGSRYRNSLKWSDTDCMVDGTVEDLPTGCTATSGLSATRFNAELSLASTNRGTDRYNTMTTMRKEIDTRYTGAFPYSFDFLYWEEVGIIDEELVRNLIICGAVILVVIFALVPSIRIAPWVVLCVAMSIVNTLGFMYYWEVTISGVSTIYVLICVGLAVDYAAHIAHMFKESSGTARERAIASMERIGPCTFNAVLSTLLAVVVVGFSDSYVFRIFFKVLFLVVVIAGAHGLWLLPAILSLVGGSKEKEPSGTYSTEEKASRTVPVNEEA